MHAGPLPNKVRKAVVQAINNSRGLRDALQAGNAKVLLRLLGPAFRGLILQRGKQGEGCTVQARGDAWFNWVYQHDRPELEKLYEAAKRDQWNGSTALNWDIEVDPVGPVQLIDEKLLPIAQLPAYRRLTEKEKRTHKASLLSWMLSQILHGEQGALFAACQLTHAVTWQDGKLYGSTQVVDEGRHVEVFDRYLCTKLEKRYEINDNLYVILDALMQDSRWDIKFLGMQIMVEGLALGAFGTIRQSTDEPLLKELLRYVITDEARHVHFGVVALRDYYRTQINDRDRREREDFAYELAVLMRNRFLAHEYYEEYWAHGMSRREWDRIMIESDFNQRFQQTLFRRIIPNLKAIGLLSDRIRPHYQRLGLLRFENGASAPNVTASELLAPA